MSAADYKKRVNEIIDEAEAQGWTVTITGGGHLRFTPPDKNKPMVHAPATSSDHRGLANTVSQLRRSGFVDR